MKFPKIIFNHNNKMIILFPLEAFWLNSEYDIPKNIVVIYRIQLILRPETYEQEIIESIIPYYLSNGYTNNFRANLLLPFYNFNLKNNNSCPQTDVYGEGTLLKISLVDNIKMKDFSTYLIKQVRNKINSEIQNSIKTDKIIKNMIIRSNDFTIDVLSVLIRMTNLLDYLIAINSEMLNQSQFTTKSFRPVNIYRGDDVFNMYNPTIINDELVYPNGKQMYLEDDIFRENLVSSLRHQLNMFKKLNLIDVEFFELNINLITQNDFNNRLHLCRGDTISDVDLINYENYKNISIELGQNFYDKLKNIIETETENIDKTDLEFANAYLLTFKNTITIRTVQENMIKWGASCRK